MGTAKAAHRIESGFGKISSEYRGLVIKAEPCSCIRCLCGPFSAESFLYGAASMIWSDAHLSTKTCDSKNNVKDGKFPCSVNQQRLCCRECCPNQERLMICSPLHYRHVSRANRQSFRIGRSACYFCVCTVTDWQRWLNRAVANIDYTRRHPWWLLSALSHVW